MTAPLTSGAAPPHRSRMTMPARWTTKWAAAKAWRWRGDKARDARRWPQAAGNYARYLAIVPADEPLWIQLGHARREAGNLAGAKEAYLKAAALAGGGGEALTHLAPLWATERLAADRAIIDADPAHRDWARTAEAYEGYLRLLPDDGPTWVQYGHALRHLGDVSGALIAYRQGAALPGSEEDGAFQLGCALRALGLETAARPHLERAMALAPRLEIHRMMGLAPPAPRPPSGERLLILDVSDLLNFLGVHGLVTGIQRVQLELAKAVLAQPGPRAGFDRIVFSFTELGWSWLLEDEGLKAVIDYAGQEGVDPAEARTLAERVRVQSRPCAPAAGSAFVNLGGFWGGGAMRGERERLRALGVKFGVMTHDIFAITLPEMCEPGVVASFEASFRAGLESWDFIVANSHFTAGDVAGLMERIGVRPIPVAAAPLAHSLGSAGGGELPEAVAGQPFVLCVGTIEPRKNHHTLIEAWKRLAGKRPDLPRLALVGRLGWRTDALARGLTNGETAESKVVWLRNVSDRQLEALYRGCLFTVFPSFAEGWGLPVGESLVHGKAVVTSNRTAMPEVGGKHALYVDPYDGAALEAALEALLYDGKSLKAREALIRRSFRPRTWSDVADDLAAGISRIVA